MNTPFLHRGYRVFSATGTDVDTTRGLIDNIIDMNIKPQHTFKNNTRTYSALFELDSQPVMLKIPRGRNRRKWERFLTLFRRSEGVRTFNNLTLMQELGLNAPPPLFAAERRKLGVVVDSFACYAFEKGQPAGPKDAQAVISALIKLHNTGYLRTDPQPANFLISGRGVVFIDFRLKRPLLFPRLKKNLELAKLIRVYPESTPYIPRDIAKSACFSLAQRIELGLYRIRQGKRKLRRSCQNKLQRNR